MAKLYMNPQIGKIAKASQFNGLRSMIRELGFIVLIDNYRSFYYGIYRKYNVETKEYEFSIVSKINEEKERILLSEGFEQIKSAYSNNIPSKYLWNFPKIELGGNAMPETMRQEF
jgi:hypothetical protein